MAIHVRPPTPAYRPAPLTLTPPLPSHPPKREKGLIKMSEGVMNEIEGVRDDPEYPMIIEDWEEYSEWVREVG